MFRDSGTMRGEDAVLYRFIKGLFYLWIRLFMRVKVYGKERMPKEGAYIVCANHMSWWDPILVAQLTPRVIHFMAKKELFEIPIIGPAFRLVNAFPVDRGKADIKAIRDSLDILKKGEVLGIFPEGTRKHDPDKLAEVHGGAALAALRGGAPIVPIALRGRYGIGSTIKVAIGEPFTLRPSHERFSVDVAEGSKRIAQEITELWREIDGEGA